MYTDQTNRFQAQPTKCVLIHGLNPIREATFGSVVFPTRESYAYSFPMERIMIMQATEEISEEFPEEITQQVSELPIEVQQGLKAVCENGVISLELSLGQWGRAYVGYFVDSLRAPMGVLLKPAIGGQVTDVTPNILSDDRPVQLEQVYRSVLAYLVPGKNSMSNLDRSPDTSVAPPGSDEQGLSKAKSAQAEVIAAPLKNTSPVEEGERCKDKSELKPTKLSWVTRSKLKKKKSKKESRHDNRY